MNDVQVTNIVAKGQYETHQEMVQINYLSKLETIIENNYALKEDTDKPGLKWDERSMAYLKSKEELFEPYRLKLEELIQNLREIFIKAWDLD